MRLLEHCKKKKKRTEHCEKDQMNLKKKKKMEFKETEAIISIEMILST